MEKSKEIVDFFKRNSDKDLGDLEAMLSGLRYRIITNGKKLNPIKRPPGYRSQKLRTYIISKGATKTTKWGPTAIRGDLDPIKKKHIIDFLNLVNMLPTDKKIIEYVFDECIKIYVIKTKEKYSVVSLPIESNIQKQINNILTIKMGHAKAGKPQQGLVYSLLILKYQYSKDIKIFTKDVFAGDQQSKEPGDIIIIKDGNKHSIFEVKGLTLDADGCDRVFSSHGLHTYPLYILANDFFPRNLKEKINSLENSFAINLDDFFLTTLSDIAINTNQKIKDVLLQLIKIYNYEFCDKIEHDNTIKITIPE